MKQTASDPVGVRERAARDRCFSLLRQNSSVRLTRAEESNGLEEELRS